MGSPLGPTLANVFLCFHQEIWLDNSSVEFKPVIYRRFTDDTFLLIRPKEHIEKFRLDLIVNTLILSLPLKSKRIIPSLFLILKSIGTVIDF